MSDIAIRVKNLSKLYYIGERQQHHRMLRDTIAEFVKRIYKKIIGIEPKKQPFNNNRQSSSFWALKDISFEVARGEIVGIIGRNGAGKSTLLKILSKITQPTEGYAEINGRASSLLEIGIGFHPELTGRENIFLNGAILGMKKNEIKARFDEIVDFSEVEKFIDTPIKYYSSGMYVRLAFAVVAHLEPEILLVDEVLAVGDIEFQKKCIGKMEKVAHEGNTVLIVSHNMSSIRALCTRALLFDNGCIKTTGQTDDVINVYLSTNTIGSAERVISDSDYLSKENKISIKRISLLNNAMDTFSVYWREPIKIAMEMEVFEDIDNVTFGAGLKMLDGSWIYCTHHNDYSTSPGWSLKTGFYIIKFTLQNELKPGVYKLAVGAHQEHYMNNLFHIESVYIEILGHTKDGVTPLIYNPGIINGKSIWEEPKIFQPSDLNNDNP